MHAHVELVQPIRVREGIRSVGYTTAQRIVQTVNCARPEGAFLEVLNALERLAFFLVEGLELGLIGKDGARVKTTNIRVPQIERKLKVITGKDKPAVKGDEIVESAHELLKLLREEAKVV